MMIVVVMEKKDMVRVVGLVVVLRAEVGMGALQRVGEGMAIWTGLDAEMGVGMAEDQIMELEKAILMEHGG